MLSRDAEGIYWMSRYMERAGHVARLVLEQLQAVQDRPLGAIERGWQRIYTAMDRSPGGGELIAGGEDVDEMLLDAFTLVDDLAFEPSNPNALMSCMAQARENARQVRSVISHEMWSCLNVAFLEKREVRLQDIWIGQPQDFFRDAASTATTFSGIADATMYRDEVWHFFLLGRSIERAQRHLALLDAHIGLFPTGERHWVFDWGSLLRVCEARGAFRRVHSNEYPPETAVDFLVADPAHSGSIAHALATVATACSVIGGERQDEPARIVRRRVGRARALISYDWPTRDAHDDAATRAMLKALLQACLGFHTDLEQAYFRYAVRDLTAGQSG